GLLLQAATTLISKPAISGLANFLFTAMLFLALQGAEYVLHPQMPMLNDRAGTLRFTFFALVLLLSGACWSLAAFLMRPVQPSSKLFPNVSL
ncbi:MAG: hypothetical protein RML93_02705, partial [Anaerolineales bacterium]|nr:hypothetical protein [Anaerolineales bacterium]MDW8446184.1 hypothetical protein [Anaerolineales bacterium]